MLLNSEQNVNIMLLMCFLEIYTFQYGYANTFEYVFGVIHKYIKKYGDSLKCYHNDMCQKSTLHEIKMIYNHTNLNGLFKILI